MMNLKCKNGIVSWQSPSNIAFVKYWGKRDRQYPMNPSLSMTLNNSHTTMEVEFSILDKAQDTIIQNFQLEGIEKPKFQQRLEKFLQSITDVAPFVANLNLNIKSSNSFPHSAGIASSASALSALALCLASIEQAMIGAEEIDWQKASLLARLGSGSACRSVYGNYVLWGKDDELESVDDYAVTFNAHEKFDDLQDAILIVDSEPKKVSSSIGHGKMNNNPFADARFQQAKDHYRQLAKAMRSGDWDTFGEILELEALTLHAMMMSSSPSFVLLKPNSLSIIEKIREFRESTKIPVYFTIDAGPNIHMIYPGKDKTQISVLLENLKTLCENDRIIHDCIGKGPVLLKKEVNG
jgi:diphosphomevalonate decarboxylase